MIAGSADVLVRIEREARLNLTKTTGRWQCSHEREDADEDVRVPSDYPRCATFSISSAATFVPSSSLTTSPTSFAASA